MCLFIHYSDALLAIWCNYPKCPTDTPRSTPSSPAQSPSLPSPSSSHLSENQTLALRAIQCALKVQSEHYMYFYFYSLYYVFLLLTSTFLVIQ